MQKYVYITARSIVVEDHFQPTCIAALARLRFLREISREIDRIKTIVGYSPLNGNSTFVRGEFTRVFALKIR